MLKIGEKVPDFELEAFHNGEATKVKLSDYAGKWAIIVFYPADFTFVCPTELEELAEMYGKFTDLDAEVLSVSTDTVFVHKAWHDHSEAIAKVKYPMLADPTGKVCRMFGTYIETEGVALRGSFVIDPNGILRAFEINDNSIGRSGKELMRKLEAARFVLAHGDQVCPASWQPGEDTLKPGMDMVGKI